jgi:hypothetical protein
LDKRRFEEHFEHSSLDNGNTKVSAADVLMRIAAPQERTFRNKNLWIYIFNKVGITYSCFTAAARNRGAGARTRLMILCSS